MYEAKGGLSRKDLVPLVDAGLVSLAPNGSVRVECNPHSGSSPG
jgi:hypothetical protein